MFTFNVNRMINCRFCCDLDLMETFGSSDSQHQRLMSSFSGETRDEKLIVNFMEWKVEIVGRFYDESDVN